MLFSLARTRFHFILVEGAPGVGNARGSEPSSNFSLNPFHDVMDTVIAQLQKISKEYGSTSHTPSDLDYTFFPQSQSFILDTHNLKGWQFEIDSSTLSLFVGFLSSAFRENNG